MLIVHKGIYRGSINKLAKKQPGSLVLRLRIDFLYTAGTMEEKHGNSHRYKLDRKSTERIIVLYVPFTVTFLTF